MLGELVNWLSQAPARFLRGSVWLGRQKPSLMVAVGKRRNVNALEEYRRRFELTEAQGLRRPLAPPDFGLEEQPQPFEAAKPGRRIDGRGRYRQDVRRSLKARLSGGGDFLGMAWALLSLTGRRLRWNGVMAVILGCAVAFGGAYFYRTMKESSNGSPRIVQGGQPLDRKVEKPEGSPSGKKLIYARLTPEGPAAQSPALPSGLAAVPKRPDAPDNRTAGAAPDAAQAANAPAPSQTAAAGDQAANKRTMVRSETYLPDGTRVDVPRPAPIPSIVRLGAAKSQPPFLAAAQPPEAAALPTAAAAEKELAAAKPQPPFLAAAQPPEAAASPAAAEKKERAPAASPVQAAEAAPSLETGYFAQFKSDQDQKAAEAELAAISEKYKAVLGDVPLKTRPADLKEKGIWIRVLAGPLKSRDEVANLCKKLKSAGIEACIVQKID